MVTKARKKAAKKKGVKGVKVLNLKPATIKDLSAKQNKKIKGGGGLTGGVVQGRKLTDL